MELIFRSIWPCEVYLRTLPPMKFYVARHRIMRSDNAPFHNVVLRMCRPSASPSNVSLGLVTEGLVYIGIGKACCYSYPTVKNFTGRSPPAEMSTQRVLWYDGRSTIRSKPRIVSSKGVRRLRDGPDRTTEDSSYVDRDQAPRTGRLSCCRKVCFS